MVTPEIAATTEYALALPRGMGASGHRLDTSGRQVGTARCPCRHSRHAVGARLAARCQ
jgi:hypothetical protein